MIQAELIFPALLAVIAGLIDLRTRRIPNWLTVPAAAIGVAVNTWSRGWPGAKDALLGMGVGLLLLLPFVLLRLWGAGDWKLVGALGAFLGPANLITVLIATLVVNGVIALIWVIWKGRLLQTLKNIGRLLAAFFSFHLPGQELTLDDPQSTKVPFGVAVAIAVIVYTAKQVLGRI